MEKRRPGVLRPVPITVGKAECKVAASSQVGYPMSKTLVDATSGFAYAAPLPVPFASCPSFPRGRCASSPLQDVGQQTCNTRRMGVSNSDRAAPFIAGRTVKEDHSWRNNLQSPNVAETHESPQLDFKKSCRLLDTKSLEAWRQRQSTKKVRLAAQTLRELQKQASRQQTKKRLLPSESESNSTSNAASTSVDFELVRHDRFRKGNSSEANSAGSVSSVANMTADMVPLGHGRLSRGYDSTIRVKERVSHTGCHSSLKQHHLTTEHFDMSVDDVNEVEDEFFPESRPVIDCG